MTDTHQRPDRARLSVREIVVEYDDPHVNEHHERVTGELRLLESIAAQYYGPDAGHRRKRLSAIDRENPATSRLVAGNPCVDHWLSQVPTAAALHPLYDPDATQYTTGHPIDEGTREWFRNIADARGIRSRAAVMRRLLTETAVRADGQVRWLSLACGAARPVFQSM